MYRTFIDPTKATIGKCDEVLDLLTCNICFSIAIEPIECSKCQAIFCTKEIKSSNDGLCPVCRVSEWKKVNKTVTAIMKHLNIQCTGCSVAIPYSQFLAHQEKCVPPTKMKEEAKAQYFDFYFDNDDEHIQYDLLSIVSMNINLREQITKFRLGIYEIDLQALIQTNSRTKYKRQIIKKVDNHHDEQPYWVFITPANPNSLFEYELQAGIQGAYERWIDSKKANENAEVCLADDNANYCINFNNMTVTNIDTKEIYQVKRTTI